MTVGISDIRTRMIEAPNFAITIWSSVIGLVNKVSMVPLLCSSVNIRIVTAGIRNKNTHGAKMNKESNEAVPFSMRLKSVPGIAHTNIPIMKRKTQITMYPIRLERKADISLRSRTSTRLDLRVKNSFFKRNLRTLVKCYRRVFSIKNIV